MQHICHSPVTEEAKYCEFRAMLLCAAPVSVQVLKKAMVELSDFEQVSQGIGISKTALFSTTNQLSNGSDLVPRKENDTCGISVKLSAGSFIACRTGSTGFAQSSATQFCQRMS